YPNPTQDVLNISYVEAIVQVEVYSISGQRVLSQEFDAKDVRIDMTGLSAGTYMVKIATEKASQYVKVIRK
ncbi:MAG TPA: T9SS type A sorting domain-containing protein, partial [Brumimicrobium sp.]|nr:T9SS type A sorting domain-containing protein [Brumimicrobium sp.]